MEITDVQNYIHTYGHTLKQIYVYKFIKILFCVESPCDIWDKNLDHFVNRNFSGFKNQWKRIEMYA